MKNRQYNGQAFYSECLDLETTIKNYSDQVDDFVDFYLFLDREFRGKQVHAFHIPHPYLLEYISSYQYSYSGYELPFQEIDVVQANQKSDEAEAVKEKLRARLIEYEIDGNALIIAHFNQGIYLKALQIPHISPVGGYDPETDMVTILDVDYLQKKHYQISFDRFYEGLANNYNRLFRAHGFDSGGYVYVKLPAKKS